MKYTGLTYRPPFEADSLLLQVTAGCSHNKCAFCTMYHDVPFEAESMEQIEQDLDEAAGYGIAFPRVFLENGDPFTLPGHRLIEIAELVNEKLPSVETIAMYASIGNIARKSDEELRRLRELGVNELNIGVESGLDSALAKMNKGFTAEEALHHLKRLKSAGIDYGANVIFGIAGRGHEEENALATAKLLNETQPYLVFTGTIHSEPGCELHDWIQDGSFEEPTVSDYLDEEELFLRSLELDQALYFGLHPSNIVRMQGILPRDKQALLDHVAAQRDSFTDAQLASKPLRYGEGAVII